jgi:hypothetical protein
MLLFLVEVLLSFVNNYLTKLLGCILNHFWSWWWQRGPQLFLFAWTDSLKGLGRLTVLSSCFLMRIVDSSVGINRAACLVDYTFWFDHLTKPGELERSRDTSLNGHKEQTAVLPAYIYWARQRNSRFFFLRQGNRRLGGWGVVISLFIAIRHLSLSSAAPPPPLPQSYFLQIRFNILPFTENTRRVAGRKKK